MSMLWSKVRTCYEDEGSCLVRRPSEKATFVRGTLILVSGANVCVVFDLKFSTLCDGLDISCLF